MRSNADLVTEQVKSSYAPVRTVQYYNGADWVALTNVVEVSHDEEAYGAQCIIRINNKAGTYNSTDLRNLKIRIARGANGEYEWGAYLWGYAQEKTSSPEATEFTVYGEGAWNKLRRWTSGADYDWNQDTVERQSKTIKDIISWVCTQAGLTLGTSISEDAVVDAWEPEITIYKGENGADIVAGLLSVTRDVLVCRADEMLLKYPQSGDAVDYNYYSAQAHYFRGAGYRLSFFRPMKVEITSGEYSGEFAHADWDSSHGLLSLANSWNVITSDADCVTMATGMVEKFERQAESGISSGPVNGVQEMHDKVELHDTRDDTSGTGRVGAIHFHWSSGENAVYEMTVALGGFDQALQSDVNAIVDAIPEGSVPGRRLLPGSIEGLTIVDGTLVVSKLGDDATVRLFSDSTTKTNIEAWKHSSDATKIDGGDIYTGSVTAAKITVTELAAITATMGILTAGEIRLGTGTVGSNFTGIRIFKDGTTYRVGGYNNDALMAYIDSDGKLKATNGGVEFYEGATKNGAIETTGNLLRLTTEAGKKVAIVGQTTAEVIANGGDISINATGGDIVLTTDVSPPKKIRLNSVALDCDTSSTPIDFMTASAAPDPYVGRVYYDTDDSKLKVCTTAGTAAVWEDLN